MTYPNWEAAAAASKANRAVSAPVGSKLTPRGNLPAVIVIGPRTPAHYAYASADGIAIPQSHAGRPSAADVDRVREWRVG